MSAPEGEFCAGGAGRGRRPSAASGALPVSAGSASSHAGGGAARLAAAAPTPGEPPAFSPPAATPGAVDTPRAGLVALSLHTPGPGDCTAPPLVATSRGAGGAAPSSPGAGASAVPDGAAVGGGGVPGQGPAATAASPSLAGDASVPDDGPPEAVGDDGLPLSAEAAASPLSPPASERHAAFLKLVDHRIKAGLQRREMRDADFSALAAEAGVPLFGGDSLIVASLRASQALSLGNQAIEEPNAAEKGALVRRAWSVLLAQALPVLHCRMDKGTLLPGTLRKVEEAYYVYQHQTVCRVTEQPVPSRSSLQRYSRSMGYMAALRAAYTTLCLLAVNPWRTDERSRAQAFVLATLHLIPKTAGLSDPLTGELDLVDLVNHIGRDVTAVHYGADFCASVLALWRSPAVADVLRARGSLQSAATLAAINAEFDARQQADLAKRGLRRCALPSCGKQEATVLQFRVCSHCQTARYCCPEHAKLHWRAHKREYEEEEEEGGRALIPLPRGGC